MIIHYSFWTAAFRKHSSTEAQLGAFGYTSRKGKSVALPTDTYVNIVRPGYAQEKGRPQRLFALEILLLAMSEWLAFWFILNYLRNGHEC